MRNRLLSITRNGIPYVRELRLLSHIRSASACILMQQLEYWFEKYPDGFYKFLSPCPSHEKYIALDSWIEELAFSLDEFRTAFDSIGVRYSSKSAYNNAAKKFLQNSSDWTERYYCSYNDKRSGLTYYFRNHSMVDSALDGLVNIKGKTDKKSVKSQSTVNRECQSTEIGNANLQKSGMPIYSIYKETEITSEINPENTQSPVCENAEDSINQGSDVVRNCELPKDPNQDFALNEDPNISTPYSAAPPTISESEENTEAIAGELVVLDVAQRGDEMPPNLQSVWDKFNDRKIKAIPREYLADIAKHKLGDVMRGIRRSGNWQQSGDDVFPDYLDFRVKQGLKNRAHALNTILKEERDPTLWQSLRLSWQEFELQRQTGMTMKQVMSKFKSQEIENSPAFDLLRKMRTNQ